MVPAIQLRSSNLIRWSRTKGNKWNLNECAADINCSHCNRWILTLGDCVELQMVGNTVWNTKQGSWLDYPTSWRATKRKVTGKLFMVFTFQWGGGKARRKKTKINWDREESKRKYRSRESARNGSQRSIWVAVTLITHSSTYFTLLLTHQANEPSTKQGIIFDNQRSLVKRVKQSSLLKEFKLEHNGLRTQEWEKVCLWIGSIV